MGWRSIKTKLLSLLRVFVHGVDDNEAAAGRSQSSQSFKSDIKLLPWKSSQQVEEFSYRFNMAELNRITNNFSESQLIGQGGFGAVYKGELRDGTLVAVKRAKKNNIEARITQEFKSEIQMLGNVEHLNLVKLIGYLEQDRERIIVSEYVSNGNLRQHLDAEFGTVLNLATRLDIMIDIAHALTYLHLYADRPIIHRDIKSSNVLITPSMRAKLGDFGFSRAGPSDFGATHVSTQVKGTAGYVDPEYLHTYQLTDKSDVFSFGILLLEIITARRPIELMRQGDERVTVRWAYQKYSKGMLGDIVDPRLELHPQTARETADVVEKIVELAFTCVRPTRSDRPSMQIVAKELWSIRREHKKPLQRLLELDPSSRSAGSRPVSRPVSRPASRPVSRSGSKRP